MNENATTISAVRAGELTGLAQDQTTTVVNVDIESRASSNITTSGNTASTTTGTTSAAAGPAAGRSSFPLNYRAPAEARQLRDIVRDSTEQWMMPSEDAENEYYEELRAMGCQNEEVEQRMQVMRMQPFACKSLHLFIYLFYFFAVLYAHPFCRTVVVSTTACWRWAAKGPFRRCLAWCPTWTTSVSWPSPPAMRT